MPKHRSHRKTGTFVALILSVVASSGLAASFSVTSSKDQVGLLELYTSEGCSSCPPADRWVSTLKQEPDLWKKFVPVAFHVDYWDYIGWPDRFASADYSRRQYDHAAWQSMRTVYTPGFFLNGREWRWRARDLGQEASSAQPGVLSLQVNDTSARINFSSNGADKALSATVALLGFDIHTKVKAGENRGRTLAHDFVVLDVQHTTLRDQGGVYSGTLTVPETDVDAGRYAMVAWVNPTGNPAPLQAVGGWLED